MLNQVFDSWAGMGNALHSIEEIWEWIQKCIKESVVRIKKTQLSESNFWFYDKNNGCLMNRNKSFFQIYGFNYETKEGKIWQPIINQMEIGYLGIICKQFNGVLHFLLQAKVEPGNINCVQISPTIQATKSNFTQRHGGKKPPYLEWFLEIDRAQILVDQLQSEQSSRFYKKRNRNIILLIEDEIEVFPNYCWMTLAQIKELMRYDNLINMDTRTVLSCIPFTLLGGDEEKICRYFMDKSLFHSLFSESFMDELCQIYNYINDYKMFHESYSKLIRLDELQNWEMDDWGIRCLSPYSFSVIYCDIEIVGREVQHWTQPMFRAEGVATFGLFTAVIDGERKFLITPRAEIGCFDQIELGPTVQRESVCMEKENEIDEIFISQYKCGQRVLYDALLSEEGGRFYHEQNRNIILETDWFEPPEGYFWVSFRTLNLLTQVNNCVNIQLRNLLALLEI